MKKLNPMVLALVLAFPVAAQAQSNAELKKEIDTLKAQIAELRQMMTAKPVAAPMAAVDPAEFSRIRLKVEAMEDTQEAMGFKGLKVSGFVDPTYIYNQRARRGSVLFLNAQDGTSNDFATDGWGYDNSNFGGATVKFEKEFDGGVKAMMSFRPHKSGSSTLIEEALVTVPIGDGKSVIAGKMISWNGYEYVNSPDMKTITHNLLYDFAGVNQVSGAGLTFKAAGLDWKAMLGNLNADRDLPGDKNRGFHWRGDATLGEFSGWGVAGMHGKIAGTSFNYVDADFWYTRGDWTLNGMVETSSHKNQAFSGDASHFGLSGLVAYKFAPGWEAVARADWLADHKNGGSKGFVADTGANECLGLADLATDPTGATLAGACGDYRNGFGPGAVFDATSGLWGITDPTRGAKRTALTFGLNYQYHTNALLKFEFRHDRSDLNSFFDFTDNSYRKSNNIFGVQTVVKF